MTNKTWTYLCTCTDHTHAHNLLALPSDFRRRCSEVPKAGLLAKAIRTPQLHTHTHTETHTRTRMMALLSQAAWPPPGAAPRRTRAFTRGHVGGRLARPPKRDFLNPQLFEIRVDVAFRAAAPPCCVRRARSEVAISSCHEGTSQDFSEGRDT